MNEIALTSRALKSTLVIDPAPLLGLKVPDGTSKVVLRIAVPGRQVRAEVNAKSLRKVCATVAEAGPDAVAVIVQGKLEVGDVLAEAGIVAQPKAPKPQ